MKVPRKPLSEETKRRIAEKAKQRPRNPEVGRKISEGMQKRKATRDEAKNEKERQERKERLRQKLDSMTRADKVQRRERLNERYEREGRRNSMLRAIRERLERGETLSLEHACQIGARAMRMMLTSRLEKSVTRFLKRWKAAHS